MNAPHRVAPAAKAQGPGDILHRHLKPHAYTLYLDAVYVARENVTFIRERMDAAGHHDFRVSARL